MTIRPCGESVSRVLTGQRINVVAAANGAEAICLIDQYAPDLLITDLCMHGIDGWKLLFHENRVRPELPIFSNRLSQPAKPPASICWPPPISNSRWILTCRLCLSAGICVA